jgi:hypothetical protein
MKAPVLIVITLLLLGTFTTLAMMNNACKTGQHSWCAADVGHHFKTARR